MITVSSGSTRLSPSTGPKNVLLRSVCVEQFNDLNAFEPADLRLLAAHLVAKAARVRRRVLQIVLRVRILIYTNGDDVRRAFAFQTLSAGKHERRIFTLHVVTIEGVGDEAIRTGSDSDVLLERHRCLAVEHVAVPHLHERSIAEQPQILRATSFWIVFVGGRVGDVNLHLDGARSNSGFSGCWSNQR
jgi:hypothetical protein